MSIARLSQFRGEGFCSPRASSPQCLIQVIKLVFALWKLCNGNNMFKNDVIMFFERFSFFSFL